MFGSHSGSQSPRPRGHLHVTVHYAIGLPAADFAWQNKNATSDPYAKLTFGGETHQTPTVELNLNPRWETPMTFKVHSSWLASENDLVVDISVWDEDQLKLDDLLGTASLDLSEFIGDPMKVRQWFEHRLELKLAIPHHNARKSGWSPGSLAGGSSLSKAEDPHVNTFLVLSVRWEPASRFPPYALRLLGSGCHGSAGLLFLVAATCRWADRQTEIRQPGVSVSCMLAGIVMLLAALLAFVLAHFDTSGLLATVEAMGTGLIVLQERSGAGGSGIGSGLCAMSIRAKSATNWELRSAPLEVDFMLVRLAFGVLAVALPAAGSALGVLAMALEVCQTFSLGFHAGEVITSLALFVVGVGFSNMLGADLQSRARGTLMQAPPMENSPAPSHEHLQVGRSMTSMVSSPVSPLGNEPRKRLFPGLRRQTVAGGAA